MNVIYLYDVRVDFFVKIEDFKTKIISVKNQFSNVDGEMKIDYKRQIKLKTNGSLEIQKWIDEWECEKDFNRGIIVTNLYYYHCKLLEANEDRTRIMLQANVLRRTLSQEEKDLFKRRSRHLTLKQLI